LPLCARTDNLECRWPTTNGSVKERRFKRRVP